MSMRAIPLKKKVDLIARGQKPNLKLPAKKRQQVKGHFSPSQKALGPTFFLYTAVSPRRRKHPSTTSPQTKSHHLAYLGPYSQQFPKTINKIS